MNRNATVFLKSTAKMILANKKSLCKLVETDISLNVVVKISDNSRTETIIRRYNTVNLISRKKNYKLG